MEHKKIMIDRNSVFSLQLKVNGDQICSEQNVFVCVFLVILEFDCNWSPFTFTFEESSSEICFVLSFLWKKEKL